MFEFIKNDIDGLFLIKPKIYGDSRGFFMETYKKSEFYDNGVCVDFVQDNHSSSQKGVLRGLHFQKEPFAQGKLVRCLQGSIYDVAIDIRPNSRSFGKYFAVELTEENKYMLFIPEGFAHGFYTLSEIAQIHYKATSEYAQNADTGIIWNDPEINIQWPSVMNPILSTKDSQLPKLKDIIFEK